MYQTYRKRISISPINPAATLPYCEKAVSLFHADARKTPLPDSSVDLVITSPPYINVFNYHQHYRGSVEALNWDLLKISRSEFGANRKHRGNRFLTVVQYCLDMAETFQELARVCRPGARLILVVGRESNIRGTRFFNGEIVAEVAHRALEYELILKQERVFTNRFGQSIYEDVLHFVPPRSDVTGTIAISARRVAQEILEGALFQAAPEVRHDIESAISSADRIQSSPIFLGR